MKRLWIADVHANLRAFEAVLDDAGSVDEIVFLGDIVGFGPHPSACLELLRRIEARAAVGNHDSSIAARRGRAPRLSTPVDWDEWTLSQLTREQLAYLASLPEALSISSDGREIVAMHHPPGAPYLHPAMPDDVLAAHFKGVSGAEVFCGHSHRAIDRRVEGRRLVCIPAVGQSRNGDVRAGYAIEQDGELQFRFVSYDIEQVVRDIEAIGLPEPFGTRWIGFLRKGYDAVWSREWPPHEEAATLSASGAVLGRSKA